MTSKERAALRGQANTLDVLFQVGKGGIVDTLVEQTDGALRTRELIKLRVLHQDKPKSGAKKKENPVKARKRLAKLEGKKKKKSPFEDKKGRDKRLPKKTAK